MGKSIKRRDTEKLQIIAKCFGSFLQNVNSFNKISYLVYYSYLLEKRSFHSFKPTDAIRSMFSKKKKKKYFKTFATIIKRY